MRIATVLAAVLTVMPVLAAGQRHVVFDDKVDFASVTTFAMRAGRATTTRPELNNRLILSKVEPAIRSGLLAKGLKESADAPDVFVAFRVGEDRPNGPSVIFNRGTLVIEVIARDGNRTIWQGIQTDDTTNPGKVAERLPGSVKKLLSEYPPKRKK